MRIANDLLNSGWVNANYVLPGTVFRTEAGTFYMIVYEPTDMGGKKKYVVNLKLGRIESISPHTEVVVVEGATLSVP